MPSQKADCAEVHIECCKKCSQQRFHNQIRARLSGDSSSGTRTRGKLRYLFIERVREGI